jgi:hypothetical protein
MRVMRGDYGAEDEERVEKKSRESGQPGPKMEGTTL